MFHTWGNWWKMWLRGEIFPLGVKMTKMGKNGTISDDSFYLMRSRNEGNHMITECVSNKFQFWAHNFNAIPKSEYKNGPGIPDSVFRFPFSSQVYPLSLRVAVACHRKCWTKPNESQSHVSVKYEIFITQGHKSHLFVFSTILEKRWPRKILLVLY